MWWRAFLKGYLTFTKRERIAVITLLLLITGIFLLPHFLNSASTDVYPADTALTRAVARLKQQQPEQPEKHTYPVRKSYSSSHPSSTTQHNLFYFDPNSLDEKGWSRLGLRDKTIGTIMKYREKGGRFRTAADLEKVYGLFPDEYARLAPYVRIESNYTSTGTENNNYTISKPAYPGSFRKAPTPIDINLADTTEWKALPAIGSKLAQRIVLFRERLGGFYSIEQVQETFGLPDSSFQKIKSYLKITTVATRKIRINSATLEELKAHPYIRYALAAALISFRTEHGAFTKVEELGRVMAMTPEILERLKPYLVLE